MKSWRLTFAVTGILVGLYGAISLVTNVELGALVLLALWLVGAVVIHDGLVSPLVIGIGWLIHRAVPPRARRYQLQPGNYAVRLFR